MGHFTGRFWGRKKSIELPPRYPYGPLGKFPHFLAARGSSNATNITESDIEQYWIETTFDATDGKLLFYLPLLLQNYMIP